MIRNATLEDVPVLRRLIEQLGYPIDLSAFQKIALSYLEEEDRSILVAEMDGQVVGSLALDITQSFHHKQKQMRIESLVVDNKFRGNGIGGKLLQKAEALAKEMDCWMVELTSSTRREPDGTHDFYIHHGYQKNGSQAYFRKIIQSRHRP